jgi:hypothetical protein
MDRQDARQRLLDATAVLDALKPLLDTSVDKDQGRPFTVAFGIAMRETVDAAREYEKAWGTP